MLGGLLAGILFKYYDLTAIFILGFIWSGIWFGYLPNIILSASDGSDIEFKQNNVIQTAQN